LIHESLEFGEEVAGGVDFLSEFGDVEGGVVVAVPDADVLLVDLFVVLHSRVEVQVFREGLHVEVEVGLTRVVFGFQGLQ